MPAETQTLPLVYLFPTGIAAADGAAVALKWAPGEGPFGQSRPLALNRATCTINFRRAVFSPDECTRIVAVGESVPAHDGGVEKGENLYRVSKIGWIEPSDATGWIFHRLGLAFAEANRDYGFELVGFIEALQYTVYGAGQRFDWHMDLGPGATSARKLSMTVQLSGPREYDGGALEFVSYPDAPERRELGSATIFPSYVAHRVAPVERGIRRSLVAWAYGPAFR
jgi:PKHD-type hydroxylase